MYGSGGLPITTSDTGTMVNRIGYLAKFVKSLKNRDASLTRTSINITEDKLNTKFGSELWLNLELRQKDFKLQNTPCH